MRNQTLIISCLLWPGLGLADHPTVGVQGGNAAPITTSSAGTLPVGRIIASVETQYLDLKPVSESLLAELAEQDQDVHSAESVKRTSLNFAWGATDRLTVGFSLPHISRDGLLETAHHDEDEEAEDPLEEHHEDAVERLGDAGGLGDLQLYGQYQLVDDGAAGKATAMIFGIKAPTGSTDEKSDGGERLETELQPGSGSWDMFFGLVYSRKLGKVSMDTNVLYTYVTEGAQDTDLGDIVNYNLSFAYPLNAGHDDGHTDHSHVKTDLVFEVNGEWRDRTEISGDQETHSGGNVIYFAPGFRTRFGEWALSGNVGFPIENLNAVQSEPDVRALVRLTHSF